MAVWNFIILLIGVFMLCAHRFIIGQGAQSIENEEFTNIVQMLGLAITLISIGIGLRVAMLQRRGEREKLLKTLEEFRTKITPESRTGASAEEKGPERT